MSCITVSKFEGEKYTLMFVDATQCPNPGQLRVRIIDKTASEVIGVTWILATDLSVDEVAELMLRKSE